MHFKTICLLFLICIFSNQAAAGVDVVNKYSLKEYQIKVFNVSCPNILRGYTLVYNQKDKSIGFDNKIKFKLDGQAFETLCDSTYQNIPPFNQSFQNKIKCKVIGTTAEERYSIKILDLKIHAQNTFDNASDSPLSQEGFDKLKNTSQSSPYCENNTGLGSGKVCKYEIKTNNKYYVFSYAQVGDFEMSDGRESSSNDYDYTVPENACGVDTNKDGLLDASELKECIKTDNENDYLCSYDYVPCVDSNEKPFCGNNGILNKQKDICELPPDKIECPAGSFYNSKLHKCTKLPTCPNNGFYNVISNKCEFIITGFCPTGYAYTPSTLKCERVVTCPSGYTPNLSQNRCQKQAGLKTPPHGYSYNSLYDLYEKEPSCPSGTKYDDYLNVCIRNKVADCPRGTSLKDSKCEGYPTCPSGTSFNYTLNKCVGEQVLECGPGASYDTSTKQCTAIPEKKLVVDMPYRLCGEGLNEEKCSEAPNYVYDSRFDAEIGTDGDWDYTFVYTNNFSGKFEVSYKCRDDGLIKFIQDGTIIHRIGNGSRGIEGSTTVKMKGGSIKIDLRADDRDGNPKAEIYATMCPYSLDLVGGTCVGSGEISCPSGSYPLNNKCIANPICPSGTTFNYSSHKCEVKADFYCPSGLKEDKGLNKCIANPICSHGGNLDTFRDKCELPAVWLCPGDSAKILIGSRYYCIKDIQCRNGYYDNTAKKCKAKVTYDCPANYSFNPSYNQCTKSPACETGAAINLATGKCYKPSLLKTISGFTFDNKNNVYFSSAFCPANSSLNFDTDKCELDQLYMCPENAVELDKDSCYFNNSKDICSQNGVFNKKTGLCEFKFTDPEGLNLCPPGYEKKDNVTCTDTPDCPGGSSYDGSYCKVEKSFGCPTAGFTKKLSSKKCEILPSCGNNSNYNSKTNRCELPPEKTCEYEYSLKNKTTCEKPIFCKNGLYDSNKRLCVVPVTDNCPSLYSLHSSNSKCVSSNVNCPDNFALSTTIDVCTATPEIYCPGKYQYHQESNMCEVVPICPTGIYQPFTDRCFLDDGLCPHGKQYKCKPVKGKMMCSTRECFKQDSATEIGDPEGTNDKEDDGQHNEEGSCIGQIYLFNGEDNRCRTAGVTTAGRSCCSNSDYLLGAAKCKESEKTLSLLKDERKCHYIGEYCSKKVGISNTCIEHKKTYCCYSSILARVLHEQGRSHIPGFTFGTAKSPVCRGFTPEEFTRLDFEKINLDEFIADIKTQTASEINNQQSSTMEDSIKNYYKNSDKK